LGAEIHGAAAKNKPLKMKFIGEFTQPSSQEGRAAGRQTSQYFLSQNAAGYATSEIDCKAYLGPDATLVYIETEEEQKEVAKFLATTDDTGSSYWIGGRYDPDSGEFIWGNGVVIGSFAPWDEGYPDSKVPVTRVSAYTVGGLKYRTQFQTVSLRYICELQLTTKSHVELKYLGQYKSRDLKFKGGISTRQTSFYFLSQNAAAFQTAENDCKAYLNENATLLYIETQEELANVTTFLQSSDDTGATYWVGGKFNTEKQVFEWLNGAELGPWASWDKGMPDTKTQLTRISANTVGSLKLRTQFNTVSNRYICELKDDLPEEEPVPCYNDNDLVIVVDSSGSIGQDNYQIALEFVTRLAITWVDNPKNRLAVIIYADDAQSIIGLADTISVAQIKDTVYHAPYLNGGTASDLGLDRALEEFTSNQRAVPLNLVFMTDGVSNDPNATLASAQNIQEAGIRSFSVGIGASINPTELQDIAGNDPSHVFNTDGFANLLKLLQPVSQNICSN